MEQTDIIYFDNAATSFPKPMQVYDEVRRSMLYGGGNAGRGAHRLSMAAARKIFDCRMIAADFFGCEDPERVVFTMNTTYALNLAIKGLLKTGDRVIISDLEHNAVYRPICALARDRGIKYDIFDTGCKENTSDDKLCEGIERLIRRDTKMLICTCASNICSRALPIEKIGRLCRKRGLIFVLDAAQGAGHISIDMKRMNIDVLCAPSHKGLYGPQGTGVLLCGEGVAAEPLLFGGTGSLSAVQEMPEFLPDRLEAGTHNVPGIAGLLAGVRYVRERGEARICRRERELALLAAELLRELPGVRVYAERGLRNQTGVLSFAVEGMDVGAVGAALAEQEIALRTGLHCAPLAHRSAGTWETGTVRLSFSDFNTAEEVFRLHEALKRLIP